MLTFVGSPAFTRTRLFALEERVRQKNPAVSAVEAEFLHFVDGARPLEPSERAILGELLRYGSRAESAPAARGAADLTDASLRLWVVPRLGTRSPWSSKATDILHQCGLSAVRRVERGVAYAVHGNVSDRGALEAELHDRMTESVLATEALLAELFRETRPRPLRTIELGADGTAALERANRELGLALSFDEIGYLAQSFSALGRDPTDLELVMFAQANSEHCRHKIFNADFWVDGEKQTRSLFRMIRRSTERSPEGVLSAYKDNAAVIAGPVASRFLVDGKSLEYKSVREPVHLLLKVETHNHPTAISPFPGAATGSGGEIRDEGATGRGARPKAGVTGFSVSNLRLPGSLEPWERDYGKPDRIASALEIMIEAPLGGAAFNNEFGRPNLAGYFRSFELEVEAPHGPEVRGYHKPIMLAGGVGNVRPEHVEKSEIPPGSLLVVLGGPALLIGLGGGAASSLASGASQADLDFASVQRDNAEMQRRCQEVIDRATALGRENPILSIHDVGAGGLSNALPELVHASDRGGHFELRDVPSDEPGMAPFEIWCNEAQERYVLALLPERLPEFRSFCERERCPFAVVGVATEERVLRVSDRHFGNEPSALPLEVLFGNAPKLERRATRVAPAKAAFDPGAVELEEALFRVLRLPAVGDKTFLITIGDRTITGLVVRDQMVGPFQVPVADAAVTASGFDSMTGEALALGERSPVALLDAAAAARLAVGEALTNIASAAIQSLSDVKLSANWMAAAGHRGEDARLFDAVRAVGVELCPALGLAIPVGKDSMSMRSVWRDPISGRDKSVTAPLSLIVTAVAPVADVRKTLTPELRRGRKSELWLLDLGLGRDRLGGSALCQVFGALGDAPPDVDDPELLRGFFMAVQALRERGLLLAYHDRSDGGLIVSALEMAFAGGVGLELELARDTALLPALFSEELGAVIEVDAKDVPEVRSVLQDFGLSRASRFVGRPVAGEHVRIQHGGVTVLDATRSELRLAWSSVTHKIQELRDDPVCAAEEHALRADASSPGLSARVTFALDELERRPAGPAAIGRARPKLCVLREQGTNGHVEMAAAFDRAGFLCHDVHMSDLAAGRALLTDYCGLVACGGFSFGDVLGAGGGWAKSILFNARLKDAFSAYFARPDTFTLGVCNGCQMLSELAELIPGAEHFPRFVKNRSERFEARLSLVEVLESRSLLLAGMAGSRLPIAVAHGEGKVEFDGRSARKRAEDAHSIALRFVDLQGNPTEHYPENPNGSAGGVTGFASTDGRVTILMPHPERVFLSVQNSWHPKEWGETAPWFRLFQNARRSVG